MPIYDRVCEKGHEMLDCYEPIVAPVVQCKECGSATNRAWLKGGGCAIPDEIPGGIWVRHGICNPDGSPRKYYSHSEMAAEAKKRDVMNWVEHIPERGTDKSKHTSRWVGMSIITEEERVKHWHDHETTLEIPISQKL